MKKTTPKIYTISDIIQWKRKGELELSPKYQRNSVWNENAKSYLIDTIIRGLPIPPIFLRQMIDVPTMTTFREIIDGQQRIRTIVEFVVEESFAIKKAHNNEYGGCFFHNLDEEQKASFLEYEISAEVVTEKDDSVIYDMFARLNSNNYVLNRQEIRNSLFWGDFKVLVYRLSKNSRDFFLSNGFFSDKECSRMKDVEYVSSLLIVFLEGIFNETPSSIDGYYKKYDKIPIEVSSLEEKYYRVFSIVKNVYDYFNQNMGLFMNKNYYYSLFCFFYHQLFGIVYFNGTRMKEYSNDEIESNISQIIQSLSQLMVEMNDPISSEELFQFKKNHIQRTTNKAERLERISFLNEYICEQTNKYK